MVDDLTFVWHCLCMHFFKIDCRLAIGSHSKQDKGVKVGTEQSNKSRNDYDFLKY